MHKHKHTILLPFLWQHLSKVTWTCPYHCPGLGHPSIHHLAFENSYRDCQYPLGSALCRAWLSSFIGNYNFFTWVTKLEHTGLSYIGATYNAAHGWRSDLAICKTLAETFKGQMDACAAAKAIQANPAKAI